MAAELILDTHIKADTAEQGWRMVLAGMPPPGKASSFKLDLPHGRFYIDFGSELIKSIGDGGTQV